MAKVVKWRGQFADIAGTQYTVEIYGDGTTGVTGNNITLGENPLVTNEDDSDDIFTPIRTQTGTLEVIDPDGTLMEQMLPADNLDHPVRVKKGNEIVWQGFLSCEAYTQDYTTRANAVTFNLIGVLEAMKSVQFGKNEFYGLRAICTIFERLSSKMTGNVVLGNMNLYIPSDSVAILTKSVFADVWFSEKENISLSSTTIDYVSVSVTEMISDICSLMGWSARCLPDGIILYSADYTGGYTKYSMPAITDDYGNLSPTGTITTAQVSLSGKWRSGHTVSYGSPVRSVEVKANTSYDDVKMDMPDMKCLTEREKSGSVITYTAKYNQYNNLARGYTRGSYKAQLARKYIIISGMPDPVHMYEGLYIDGYNSAQTTSSASYVYSHSLSHKLSRRGGYIRISMAIERGDLSWNKKTLEFDEDGFKMCVGIIYDGMSYNPSFNRFENGETYKLKLGFDISGSLINSRPSSMVDDGYYIPLKTRDGNVQFSGDVKFVIYPEMTGKFSDGTYVRSICVTSFTVDYVKDVMDVMRDDSDSYTYKAEINKGSEDISIETNLASDRNTKLSTHVLRHNIDIPLTLMMYKMGTEKVGIRPEARLLSRMKAHYSDRRKTYTIHASDIQNGPALADLGITGEYYAIVSDTHDWRMNDHEIKCAQFQPEDTSRYTDAYIDPTKSVPIDASEYGTNYDAYERADDCDGYHDTEDYDPDWGPRDDYGMDD